MKYLLIFLCGLSSVTLYASPVKDLDVKVFYFRTLHIDSYFTDNETIYIEEDKESFVEVYFQIENKTSKTHKISAQDILFVTQKGDISPALFFVNSTLEVYGKKMVKVPTGKTVFSKAVFIIPANDKATQLLRIRESGDVPLTTSFEKVNAYFDSDWKEVKNISEAVYFRQEIAMGEMCTLVKDSYMKNGSTQMVSETVSNNSETKNGITTWYHENGNVKKQGMYRNDYSKGTIYTFYESGLRESKIAYEGSQTRYLQYWNNEGETLLTNGNGTVERAVENGRTITIYNNYDFDLSMNIRTAEQDTLYGGNAIEAAVYPGGYEAFYIGLRDLLVYPVQARRTGVEGKVFVQFLVGKAGLLEEIQVVKGIGGGCDDEVLRVMNLVKPWQPATYQNKPVKMRIVLPVTFRLN